MSPDAAMTERPSCVAGWLAAFLLGVLVPTQAFGRDPIRWDQTGATKPPSGQAHSARPDVGPEHEEIEVRGEKRGYLAKNSGVATKTDTPLLETPQSVAVITSQQIRDQNAQTLGALLRYAPGVMGEEYGGTDLRFDNMVIRGFEVSMPYVDGLSTVSRYTLLSPSIEPYGLDRAEVLLGPSSVLYGQNPPGGLVNLVTKHPIDTPLHEVVAEAGNWGHARGAFDLGGPIDGDGRFLYRLTGEIIDTGTQVDHLHDSRYYLAPAFTYRPSTRTDITLLSHFQRIEAGFLNQYLPAEGTLTRASFGRIPTSLYIGEPGDGFTRTEWAVGYQINHRMTDYLTLRQNLRFTHTNYVQDQFLGQGIEPGTTLLDRAYLGANAWQNNFAVDNSVQYTRPLGPVSSTFIAGVDYLNAHDSWFEVDGSGAPLDILHPVYDHTTEFLDIYQSNDLLQQVGLYAQEQASWHRMHLTGSLREDWTESRTWDNFDTRVAPDNHRLTGRIGALYLFDCGVAPYVSYSTSFQPTLGIGADGSPLKPTSGRQIEVGVKYQPRGMNSFFTASAYQIKQNNVSTADPYNPASVVQTGQIRVRGIDLSGLGDLGNGLKFTGTYSFMDGVITKALPFAISGRTIAIEGNRAPNVPKNTAKLWLDETLPSGHLKGLGAGIGIRYMDARNGDRLNSVDLHAVTLADLTVHDAIGHWRLGVNIQNLANTRYVAGCYDAGLNSTNSCFYGVRRSIYGNVGYSW